MKKAALFLALGLLAALTVSCSKAAAQTTGIPAAIAAPSADFIVTFIELGSVSCIPCKAMQPIMEELRQKYPKEVNVVFHDVWTKEGEPFGKQFGIRVIPTQIFLDRNGREYFRHEGFFPMEELKKILVQGGVTL